MGQSERHQVRAGDDAGGKPDEAARAGHGLAAVCGGGGDGAVAEPAGDAGPLREHHRAVGGPEGRAHVRPHPPAGQAADAGAAGEPCDVRRLHPLVPARRAGHLERVPLRANYVRPAKAIKTRALANSLVIFFFSFSSS